MNRRPVPFSVPVPLLPAVLALLGACDASSGPATTIAIDSAGLEVVTSDPLNSDAVCSLGAEPIFRVGDNENDEAHWFSYIRGVGRLSDGSVAVVDRTSAEIRIFDETGRHLRSMGRPGEGPGEFNDAWKLWILPGDTLWVGDYRPWRYQVFTASGDWVRTARLDPVYPSPSRWGGVLDNGVSINTTERRSSRRDDFSTPDTLVVELHDAGGRMMGTLARLPTSPVGRIQISERAGLVRRPIFAPSPLVDAGGRTIALAVGRDTEVRLLDDGFRLRRIVRWSDPDRDVTGADVQAWRDDYIESRGGRDSPEWSEREEAMIDPEVPVADQFPSMSGVMIGRDGRLWVLPYQRPRADRVRWMGFEPDGSFLCHLESAQSGLSTFEFGEDYWLGVHSDELGIETAVMYDLHTPAPAAPADAPAGSEMP